MTARSQRLPLKDFCKIVQGGRLKLSGKHFVDSGFPAYGAGGQNGYLPEPEFHEPAVILSAIGARCGKCFLTTGKWASLANTQLIFPDASRADVRFLWYQLNEESSWHRSGTGQPFIKPSDVKNRLVVLPPLPEQKRIAAILDAADTLRAKRRESIEQLDSLVQATFLEMFGDPVTNPKGWAMATLPDGATVFTDGPFGSNLKSSHYAADGIRVIRLQNIGIGQLLDDDLAYITEEHFDSLPRNHCIPGDVIIGTLGDPNLRACVIPLTLPRSLNKADCILLRPNTRLLHAAYACGLLNTPSLVTKALELVRGQTRGRISMGRLKTLPVPLPPAPLQTRFASIVESIEQQKARLKAHLAELDTLFASLQSRAFNGELVA